MSSFILPADHIGCLVNLGYELNIRAVHNEHSNIAVRLNLENADDRKFVANELIDANINSVCTRYGTLPEHPIQVPCFLLPSVPLTSLEQFAQALQWVRCYQYQSCEGFGWKTTFAYQYTERVRMELETKIISCFATSWVYNGMALT